jgi:hypothetical protein
VATLAKAIFGNSTSNADNDKGIKKMMIMNKYLLMRTTLS